MAKVSQNKTCFKGMIMMFGLFRIRKNFAFWQELYFTESMDGAEYVDNVKYLKRLEPWLQKWCTIKWIKADKRTEKEVCYL